MTESVPATDYTNPSETNFVSKSFPGSPEVANMEQRHYAALPVEDRAVLLDQAGDSALLELFDLDDSFVNQELGVGRVGDGQRQVCERRESYTMHAFALRSSGRVRWGWRRSDRCRD